jgi:FRG domain
MAYLETPSPKGDPIQSVTGFLNEIGKWQKKQRGVDDAEGYLSQLWYRGVKKYFPNQVPGVYRNDFTDRATTLYKNPDIEDRRLHLEREMLAQFRSAGAAFLKRDSEVDIYFTAQHFGMPTRLLDWSTNPLAALFFACDGSSGDDGAVYAMDARQIIPPNAMTLKGEKQFQAVMTMRHPYVEYAIKLAFWNDPKPSPIPYVVPVRPDIVPGRLGQQSSCFTLHVHKAPPVKNGTLATFSVAKGSKGTIREDLHRLNINQFTIYYDLDHLSKEIKRSWGFKEVAG